MSRRTVILTPDQFAYLKEKFAAYIKDEAAANMDYLAFADVLEGVQLTEWAATLRAMAADEKRHQGNLEQMQLKLITPAKQSAEEE